MAEAGWYPDPHGSSRLRYWDGAQWTEHTHDQPSEGIQDGGRQALAGTSSGGQVGGDPPPFTPAPDGGRGGAITRPAQLNDIGTWLRQTFKVGFSKLLPSFALALMGFLPIILIYVIMFAVLLSASFDSADGLQGVGTGIFFLFPLLFLLWILWSAVISLAQNHLLHQAHVGHPTSVGQSLRAGGKGLGRLIVAYLTLFLYFILAGAVVAAIVLGLGLLSDTLAGIAFILAYIAFFVASIWLTVKLAFIVLAAAVAPDGYRPLRVSMQTTDGYFWAILGRILLLGLIMFAALIPFMLIMFAIGAALGGSFFNDPDSASGTALAGLAIVGFLGYILLILSMQVFSTSGLARLYIDAGGPARTAARL